MLNLLLAFLELGVPMALLSWLLFMRFFGRGELDRQANRREIDARVKEFKTNYKSERKKRKRGGERGESLAMRSGAELIFEKWMVFGSGFYGLAAFWTLLVIEFFSLAELAGSLLTLSLFEAGWLQLLIGLATEQLSNFISALLWFNYWGDSLLANFAVAYAGYWLGIEAARRNLQISKQTLLAALKQRISPK